MKRGININNFLQVIESVTEGINQRAKDMIAGRFGFGNKENMTLSQIGNNYGITRERVRQIIQESINKVKQKAQEDVLFKEAEENLKFTVKEKYGIILKDDLVETLSVQKEEENFIKFLLFCSEKLEHNIEKKEFEEVVIDNDFDFARWKYVRDVAKTILEERNKALTSEVFFDEFSKKTFNKIEKNEFLNFLVVSKEIKQNVFGKWGISGWKETDPKGVREKAYLVMQETKKPLHFKEVARLINKYKLSKKKSHPQTVHNELIKDERFVLVGRGTYALNEWGYQKGTVKDVIENILKNKQEPLHQEEIMKEVLLIRNVKPTTIVINLNNFFEKVDGKKYFLKN